MTKEEIVLAAFSNNRWLGRRPSRFGNDVPESEINDLKNTQEITERVYKIFKIAQYFHTIDLYNRFQCRSGANRSTGDIWRIYKYYFGDVDIFTIMRALYKLVADEKLGTFRCSTVRKRLFWLDKQNYFFTTRNYTTPAELGVPLSEWKDIGL